MDYYLENPNRLNGQPKRTIADYVEQNGILVPRSFDSLQEARRSHKRILLRSEHSQEYDGVSGLLDSFALSSSHFLVKGLVSAEEIKQRYFDRKDDCEGRGGFSSYGIYCKLLGLNQAEFRRQTSFSIWEALPGFNRTVVADSAVEGRYHIMTMSKDWKNRLHSYTLVDNGAEIKDYVNPLPEELRKGLSELIETYEKIRTLGRFDNNHCPIMEFQTFRGKNYFLQYHRTRDFSPAGFTLDRGLQEGEIEIPFVRGATSKEGGVFKVTVYYSGDLFFNPEDEDGSFDFHRNTIFSDLQYRKRRLQVRSEAFVASELDALAVGHYPRSRMFKPEVSAILPIELVLRDNEVVFGGSDNIEFGEGSRFIPRNPIFKEGEEIFDFSKE